MPQAADEGAPLPSRWDVATGPCRIVQCNYVAAFFYRTALLDNLHSGRHTATAGRPFSSDCRSLRYRLADDTENHNDYRIMLMLQRMTRQKTEVTTNEV